MPVPPAIDWVVGIPQPSARLYRVGTRESYGRSVVYATRAAQPMPRTFNAMTPARVLPSHVVLNPDRQKTDV
jgi:hypothetical protein